MTTQTAAHMPCRCYGHPEHAQHPAHQPYALAVPVDLIAQLLTVQHAIGRGDLTAQVQLEEIRCQMLRSRQVTS